MPTSVGGSGDATFGVQPWEPEPLTGGGTEAPPPPLGDQVDTPPPGNDGVFGDLLAAGPSGAVQAKAGGKQGKPIPVEVEITHGPDVEGTPPTDPKLAAETRPKWSLPWKVETTGDKVTGGTVKLKIDIETVYKDLNDRTKPSLYGRGTTKEDQAAGNTSLKFHEQQHHVEYEKYMKDNPPPTPKLREGMTKKEAEQEIARYKEEIKEYLRHAGDVTGPLVDEVGVKKSKVAP
jgi:hypothetical protein